MAESTLAFDSLVSGASQRVQVGDVAVLVVRIDDDVYAIGDTCSHARVSLADGEVWADDCEVECPRHGSTFDLRTGVPTVLPATQPVPVFAVVVDREANTVTITADQPSDTVGTEATSAGGTTR